MPVRSIPYRCLDCMTPDACEFNGVLVFETKHRPLEVPVCKHDEKPGKPCHPEPVFMVPSK